MNLFGAILALCLATLILAASPWWPASQICAALAETPLCARPGMFGLDFLHWRGDWVSRWLRGTELAESALLIWAVGAVLGLTFVEKLITGFRP